MAAQSLSALGAIALGIAGVLLTSGCAAKRLPGFSVESTPVYISSLPPLLQNRNVSCGPTALSCVAAYWRTDYRPLLANENGGERLNAHQLRELAESIGLKGLVYGGSLEDLEAQVMKGRPVIVLLSDPVFDISPFSKIEQIVNRRSHWIVVLGFTKVNIVAHDPAKGRIKMRRSAFAERWKERLNTTLLVAPNDQGQQSARSPGHSANPN